MKQLFNLKVDEYTTPSPISVSEEVPYDRVRSLMTEFNIRHIPVVNDEDKPIGIISERDVLNVSHLPHNERITASGLMTTKPFCVKSDDSLGDVSFRMSQGKIGSAVVVEGDGTLFGIFTSTDALNALVEILRGDYEGDESWNEASLG